MAESEAPKDGAAGKGKLGKGLLTGKNKWYIIGGLGIVAVLVFFFVSRSNSSSSGAGSTTGAQGGLDPSTQAALQSALQGQAASGGFPGIAGDTGPAGPQGPPGAPGRRGKPGKPGKAPPHKVPHRPPPHKRAGHTSFATVRPGDSLGSMATAHNVPGGASALYNKNRSVIGSNPDSIHPGQRLQV